LRKIPDEQNTGLDAMINVVGRRYMNWTALANITLPILQSAVKALVTLHKKNGSSTNRTMIVMNDFALQKGGYVAPDATAFYRKPWFNFQIVADWADRVDLDGEMEIWADGLIQEIVNLEENDATIAPEDKRAGKMAYWNASNGKASSERVFGSNYSKLRIIKKKFDPENIFNKWYPIQPSA
jgi:Berberine and berberine like